MVDETPSLPLAQQILAWLFQALGYEPETNGPDALSATTLKNARRGRIIRRSWRPLVEQVCRVLKLSKTAPATLSTLLRQWDGYVSTLRTPPLDLEDRVLPIMRVALPGLGVRLGAAMALVSVVRGQATREWEWMRDPLAPEVFRTVLRLVLKEFQPGWDTWSGRRKERGRIRRIDPKTIRRWDTGDVPGPQNINTLVEQIGPDSEVWLRWARAAMVVRRDLEGWVGKGGVDSWRQAISAVAMRVGPTLASDPQAIARLAEMWAESLENHPGMELAVQLASILGLVEPMITPETVLSWLLSVSAHGSALPSDSKQVRAMLLLSVILPHPRVIAGAYTHLTPGQALILATADLRTRLNTEWSLRWLLRAVERGEPIQRPSRNGTLEIVAVHESMKESARQILRESATFTHDPRGAAESSADTDARTLFAPLLGISSAQFPAVLEEAEAALSYLFFDSSAERSLPAETVRELPKLGLSRARRLLMDGDVSAAMTTLEAVDLSGHEPYASERGDLADILSELAHHVLDQLSLCLRPVLEELRGDEFAEGASLASVLEAVAGESIDACLAGADRFIDEARRWLEPHQLNHSRVEVVVLTFPYELRRERLLGVLGRSSHGASKVGAMVEIMSEHARRSPSSGDVAAMLALARELECTGFERVPNEVGHRCEHLGTTALRDKWLVRIRRDLTLP